MEEPQDFKETGPAPAADTPESPPENPPGWLDVLAGVLFSPRATFERLAQQPPLGLGLAVFVVVHLAGTLIQSRGLAETLAADLTIPDLFVHPGTLAGPLTVFMLVMSMLVSLTTIGLIHLGAGLLGGTGHGRAMTALAGLAYLPGALGAPLTLLENAGVRGLWVFTLGIGIWQIYLHYRAVRAVHHLPRRRAVGALLTPVVMLLAVLTAFAILFGTMLFEAYQQLDALPLP